ncbi:TPA: DUF4868 domain-containing protein [Legionella pneumophila]|uniref:Kiwa anti-phage protein KwaB-like domain-containing protein n=1 Tax=Legionella pneumophila TaxID=446 RepID=UPI000483CF0C|nr:Kiwa anti-phage protein KwaB-like domain-containing protein [Legionella pneumophila]SNV20286.1 Uncharacterised protein [Legionella pneumophila]HAT8692495.1 DUF4868 domain-containing protein [Legionella pneumophila]HAU1215342.1 DUF4868 domain-containing protein [Legionella pneumophila]
MPFNFNKIETTEFGVCIDEAEESYYIVPSDHSVQNALKEMLTQTMDRLNINGEALDIFDPADKYGTNERLVIPLDSEYALTHCQMYKSDNLTTNSKALNEPQKLICYFGIFHDDEGNKLLAFRKASYFKGEVKKQLIAICDDSLRMVSDRVFKLDHDFDFVVFDNQVYIWRPSGFVYVSGLDEQISASSIKNLQGLSQEIPFINFDTLQEFISTHKRAMRLVASLASRSDLKDISLAKLKKLCSDGNIGYSFDSNVITIDKGHEMTFLMLLDRRLYKIDLIEDKPEIYQAASRKIMTKT